MRSERPGGIPHRDLTRPFQVRCQEAWRRDCARSLAAVPPQNPSRSATAMAASRGSARITQAPRAAALASYCPVLNEAQ